MSRGRLVIGIVAVACAAAAVFFATRPSTAARAEDRPAPTEEDHDAARMQRQIEQLAAEVRRLRSRPPTSDGASAGAAGATDAPEAAGRPEEAGPPREEVVRNALERQVAGEERDSGWASGTEQAIHAVLATEAFTGTAVVGADCRTTVCRVHVVHDGEEAKDTFASEVAGTPPFDTEGVLWNAGTEEAPETVLFVAREGDALAIPR